MTPAENHPWGNAIGHRRKERRSPPTRSTRASGLRLSPGALEWRPRPVQGWGRSCLLGQHPCANIAAVKAHEIRKELDPFNVRHARNSKLAPSHAAIIREIFTVRQCSLCQSKRSASMNRRAPTRPTAALAYSNPRCIILWNQPVQRQETSFEDRKNN